MKRLFDVLLALIFLVMAAPVMALIALRVRREMGSPVLFKQVRPGLYGQPFVLYKFRTMKDARYAQGNEVSDSERLTSFGRRLRATSLDELPELWNVLRGDMSLVGPRPLLQRYLPYYTSREQLRHTMRPGITGWAQINGRNTVSWDERLAMDVWYVEHHSLLLDVKVLWLTLWSVLHRSGVQEDPRSMMRDLDEERRTLSKAEVRNV